MSLLLDALKRAEQEKLARQPGAAAPAAAPPSPRPGALELQPMPATGAAGAAAGPRPEPAAAQAAQNVFQAKAAREPEGERSRAMLWVTVGAVALVAMAAAGYVWYTVKSLTPQYASTLRPRPAPTPPPASSGPVPQTTGASIVAPAATQPVAEAASTAVQTAPPPPAPPSVAAPPTSAPAAPAAVLAVPPESAAERLARAAAEAPATPPLQMERTPQAGPRVPPEIASGYDALRVGNWAEARRAYQAALAKDPSSVDAHLGLATIAARGGNRPAAAEHYRRALEFDPRNATAAAGLAALADFSRPEALEAQLRTALDRAPDSAPLQFTIGNLYAAQGRWKEAQSAYYEAHRLDPGSPEIAHNLAVSLDRLGQRGLAAGFYRRALEAARGRASPVDTAAVARRLAEIE